MTYPKEGPEASRRMFGLPEVLEDALPSNRRLQDSATKSSGACQTQAAGLLIGIEYSRVRDSLWMYLTSFVNTQIGVELAAVQRKLPDCVVVGFQLNSARTFHVTISPGYIRAGRDPLQTIIINT